MFDDNWADVVASLSRAVAHLEASKRELARRELLYFTEYFTRDYQIGRIHREICDLLMAFIEACERKQGPRLIIQLPPRHGKSQLVSRALPAFILGKHPEWEVVTATYAQDLANDLGRDVRSILNSNVYPDLFPKSIIRPDSNAIDFVKLQEGGSYRAVGVGGGLTGMGAHCLLIDDPVKNRADADSELVRETTWHWYQSVARTRLAPGGGICLCLCMTGDTLVMRPDGTETMLRDIRPGDAIATCDHGRLSTATVRRWSNQGKDSVFAIRLAGGRILRANARHPFLVWREGGPTWVRVSKLKLSDQIMSVSSKEPGAGSSAPTLGATRLCGPRDSATSITSVGGSRMESVLPAKVPTIVASTDSSIATGSPRRIISTCSKSRAEAVLSAEQQNLPEAPAGGSAYASTTTTARGSCVDSCATTATCGSDAEPLSNASCAPWTICDFTPVEILSITPDGVEDVFDVEVDRTENFIANGCVSHNTRWHEEDLAGKVIQQAAANPAASKWHVYSCPAIAIEKEAGREVGEALHPERWSLEELEKLRADMDPREWSALFQQNPTPPEGLAFKREWFVYETPPEKLNWYISTDFAIGENSTNDRTVLLPYGISPDGTIYFDAPVRARIGAEEIIEKLCDMMKAKMPMQVAIENVHISKTIGPFLRRRMQERMLYPPTWSYTATRDKLARSASLRGRMEQGRVRFHPTMKNIVEEEFIPFPAGRFDDTVDAASVGMLMLDTLIQPAGPPPPPKEGPPPWSMDWIKERVQDSEKERRTFRPHHLNGRPRAMPKARSNKAWTE